MSFSHAHGTFANTDNVLGQKTCQIMEIIQNMFAWYYKLEIDNNNNTIS